LIFATFSLGIVCWWLLARFWCLLVYYLIAINIINIYLDNDLITSWFAGLSAYNNILTFDWCNKQKLYLILKYNRHNKSVEHVSTSISLLQLLHSNVLLCYNMNVLSSQWSDPKSLHFITLLRCTSVTPIVIIQSSNTTFHFWLIKSDIPVYSV